MRVSDRVVSYAHIVNYDCVLHESSEISGIRVYVFGFFDYN